MNIYITFQDRNIPKERPELNRGILARLFYYILPKANPDFETKIDLVESWYLEFKNNDSVPIREVGVDFENKVILKMPYKKNIGYWTDNFLKYNDFERLFIITRISRQFFEEKWDEFL